MRPVESDGGGVDDAAAAALPRQRMPRWLSDLTIAIAIVVLTFLPLPGDAYATPTATAIAAALVAAVVLPWRRRFPLVVLGVVLVLFGAAALAGVPHPGMAFAVAVGAFGVTSRTGRTFGLWVTGATLVVVALFSIVGTVGQLDPRAVQLTLTVLVGAALGDASRSRWELLAAVTERAQRAEQTREAEARRRVSEERLRIARDLHDAVAHQISVISLNAGVASSAFDAHPDRAKQSLQTIRRAARTVLAEISGLLEVLRAGEDPSSTASQPGLEHIEALARQFADDGMAVTVRVAGDASPLPGPVGGVAYAVVREALTNAHKHGSGRRADLSLSCTGDVFEIVVTNPASAASGSTDAPVSGWGLTGLRERVAAVRGTVAAGPDGTEWRLRALLPVAGSSPPDPTPEPAEPAP